MIQRAGSEALFFCAAAIAIATAACGGAEGSVQKAPAAPYERTGEERAEPKTVEEAEAQIAAARADLEGPKTSPHPATEPPAATAEKRPQGGAPAPPERAASEDSCAGPCRALASMRRAVEALCRLTAESDERCVQARRTLAESTTRVSSCKCEGR